MPPRAEPAIANEPGDLATGRVYLAGGALLLVLIVVMGGLWLFFGQSSGPAIGLARPDPPAELEAFNARETMELNTLGWSDPGNGLARIPVATAMQLIAQRGKLPSWAVPASGQRCSFLENAVPRSPATSDCTMGWGRWLGRTP